MTRPRNALLLAMTLLLVASCSSDDPGMDANPIVPGAGASGAGLGGAAVVTAGTTGAAGMTVGGGGSTAMAGTGSTAGAGGTTGGMAGASGVAGGMAGAGAGGAVGSMAGAGAGGAAGSMAGTGGTTEPGELPECDLSDHPDQFEPNATPGGGGATFTDSPHFRIYGATGATADGAIKHLEAAYSCFVETLCWRSSGLSFNGGDSGPFYKMNIYAVGSLTGGAAGVMSSNAPTGMAFLQVVTRFLSQPGVIVHEYGHALTYHEKGWVMQEPTGAWWETVANFVADSYSTSTLCKAARDEHGVAEGDTAIDLRRVIGNSYQVIVDGMRDTANHYQAWPFLTYLTNNPDGYPGLGPTALRNMFREHMGNDETPLHVLERGATGTKVQTIVGRYWARMAYLDIGHPKAQQVFLRERAQLNFANLQSAGAQTWRAIANRRPQYFGSNIIPLSGAGEVSVTVTSADPFTATLAIRASSGSVRYVDLPNGTGMASVQSGEEASLVVVNTPAALYQYDPFGLSADVTRGLDYTVMITGATPTN